jgi:hypothetical protein
VEASATYEIGGGMAGFFIFVSFTQGASHWKSLARTRDINMLIGSSRVDSTRRDGVTGYRLRFDYSRPQFVAHDSTHPFAHMFIRMALNCHRDLQRGDTPYLRVTNRHCRRLSPLCLLLLAVALIAAYLPAHRATRVEPVNALRAD